MTWPLLVVVAAALGVSRMAYAQPTAGLAEPAQLEPSRDPSTGERALALTAAVFPGVIVHGSGSWVLGRDQTGARLLVVEAGGLSLIFASLATLFYTGAARNLAAPAAASAVAGMGLFSISWQADLYAAIASPGGWGRAATRAPAWETELGYRHLVDPRFQYRSFLVTALTARSDRVRFSPALWASADDSNSRLRLEVAYRFWGPTRAAPAADGSYLELELAATEHRYPRERFTLGTLEWFVGGRLDLQRLAPDLAGSFGEMGVGSAHQVTSFEVAAAESTSSQLLLQRFAFGVYEGDPSGAGGEWAMYYDHRHDDYAGGLLMPGLGSGVAGHIGLAGQHFFDRNWGFGVLFEVGSACVAGLSGLFRDWGAP
jgi:hypothetical protein